LLLFILISSIFSSVSAHTLYINTGWTPPVSTLLGNIIGAIFQRAGITLEFKIMPAERSLTLVARGIDDGECCRIPKAIARDYPDLLQVPEIVYTAKFSAFAKHPVPEIKNFDDLRPYSVGTIAGWKILVNNLKRVDPQVLHIMDNPKSMFRILQKDRIDIATFGYLSGLKTLSELGLNDIEAIQPPLASAPLYLYLHKKNKAYIPALTKALKELKAEGEIDRIIQQSSRF